MVAYSTAVYDSALKYSANTAGLQSAVQDWALGHFTPVLYMVNTKLLYCFTAVEYFRM